MKPKKMGARLMLAVVTAGACLGGTAVEGDSFCSLRCGSGSCEPENWPKVLEALSQTPRPFDAIWFSTGVAYPKLEWHREQSARCAEAAKDLAKIGMSASVEIQMTIGHTDEMLEKKDCSAQDWPRWVGWDGTVGKRVSCPRGENFRKYFAEVAAIYAQWKPECIWIDDDLRIDNRAPSPNRRKHWGCWCERCIGELSKREGKEWTRETLLAAIEGGDKALEGRWLEVQVDGIAELAGVICEAIVRTSPEVRLGLQAKGHKKILQTMRKITGGPIRMRPGAGSYWDTNPHAQLNKAYWVTKAADDTECLDLVDMVCPEIESCPRTFSCRTPQGVILEGFEQLALVANALSMFVADTRFGEDWEGYYRDVLFKRLGAAHEFLKGFAEANRGTLPCGFTVSDGVPKELVACRGVPVVCGRAKSLGELPDVLSIPVKIGGAIWQAKGAPETIVMQTAAGPDLMKFAAKADAICGGKTPIVFMRPVMAWTLPRVRENGELRTVAIVNASIDVQDAVGVRLRGVREGTRVEWIPLHGERKALAVTRDGGDAIVEIPSIGAWDCGYLFVIGGAVKPVVWDWPEASPLCGCCQVGT